MGDLERILVTAAVGIPAALLTSGMGALLGWLWVRHKAGRDARERQSEIVERLDELAGQYAELVRQNAEIIASVANVTEAQHVGMRQQLLHNAEKYIERGWLTPEERQAWFEMFVAYGMLGKNGFIRGYWDRLEDLPDRQV